MTAKGNPIYRTHLGGGAFAEVIASEDVMMCTGVEDVHGKMIFEEDIVEFWYDGIFEQGTAHGIVAVFDGRFFIDFPDHGTSLQMSSCIGDDGLTIVGNTFDNPNAKTGLV